jgi:hypothetical protein
MLSIQIIPDRPEVIQTSGSLREIVAELGIAVGDIYSGLRQNQPKAAECFKNAMQSLMREDAPTWNGEMIAGGTYIFMSRK